MNTVFRCIRSLIVIGLLLCSSDSFATHIVGMDLSYSYVSGNTYKITLVAYGDCAGSAFPSLSTSSPLICIYDGNTSIGSLSLTLQAPTNGIEITPVCPADSSKTQCTSLAFSIPGIKKFVYTGTYTLPYTSSVWRFLFTGNMGTGGGSSGRGSTITNITSPGSSIIQLVDTLNNTVYHNNSPALTVLPTPYFCLNQPDNYNPGAADSDADSLAFALVSGINGTTNCATLGAPVTYVTPYTGASPLATSSFLFDSRTGQITFKPNALQRSLVVYNIEEYRGGTLVGTCQREMTFLVLTCTSSAPDGGYTSATAGTIVDSIDYTICNGTGAFSIIMTPKEADTSNNINVTATGLPPSITFTTTNNNTNHPICTISGNTSSLSVGTYIYYVTFKDNACPINGLRTVAFTITVLPVPVVTASPGVTICQGTSTTLSASGGVTYSWSPGSWLSCTVCPTPIATPASTTLYTVTGTSINGCGSKDTVRVTVLPQPILTLSPPITLCVGASTGLSVSGTISYLWTPAATLSCNTCTNPIAKPGTTTTYFVTGTGSNGCTTTANVTITVNALPVISIAPTAICSGISTTLYPAGAVSYIWTPGSSLSCTACVNPISSATVTTTYSVTGTDANGCKDTASVTVLVSPTPPPPGVVTPVTYCQNATSSALTATGSSLLWYTTATGGTGSTTAPIPSTMITGVTKWYVSQTVGGCESKRDSITVTVNALPVVAISPSNPVICAGDDTTLTGSGAATYIWTPAATLSSSTGAIVIAKPTTTTTYTVTGTSSNGCVGSATVTVLVRAIPFVTIAPPAATICAGSNASFVASGAVTYLWTPSSTLTSSTAATVIASPTVTTTYTVTGTDAFGCINTSLATLTVNPIPAKPVVVSPVVYCQSATPLALIATGTGLLWYTVPAGGTGTSATPTPSTTIPGTTTWYVSQTISGCESARDSINVVVNSLPLVTATATVPVLCSGQNTTLTAAGALSYTWGPSTGLLTPGSGPVVLAAPTLTTVYTVIGTDINGCANTATVLLTINPLPVIVVPDVIICAGSDATLTASGADTYIWSPATTLSSSTGASVISTTTITATYIITGTDIFGCVNSTTATATVNPIPLAPDVVSPVYYCQHHVAPALTATGTSLLWYTAATGGAGTATAPVPSTDNLDTTIWYVSQTAGGCESPRKPITVIIKVSAEPDFTFTIKYGCIDDTVQFTNNSKNAYRYLWDFGDHTTDTSSSPVHYYKPVTSSTDVNVVLHGYNAFCFADSMLHVLTINPTPPFELVNVTGDKSITYGDSVQLNADGAITYSWIPEDGSLTDNHINNPIATPKVDTTHYIVTGTDIRGCVDTAQVRIFLEYEDNPFIPTAFTPNGDGDNDIMRILNLKYNKLVAFRIFNRWGQVVFFTTDVNEGWDGKFNGVPQELGVYEYLFSTVHPDGKKQKSYKGDITLIR
jgi:gliding motility-associated-like protein